MPRSKPRFKRQVPYLAYEDKYVFSEAKAAEFLGVSHRKLTSLRHQNNGPLHIRLGPYIRYSLDDLSAFLHERITTTYDSEG
jgi:hypothetical protein